MTNDDRFARRVHLLHTLSPAPATLVVPYTEPFFALFSFSGSLAHVHGSRVAASILWAVATWFRPLGILNAGFLVWDWLEDVGRYRRRKISSLVSTSLSSSDPADPGEAFTIRLRPHPLALLRRHRPIRPLAARSLPQVLRLILASSLVLSPPAVGLHLDSGALLVGRTFAARSWLTVTQGRGLPPLLDLEAVAPLPPLRTALRPPHLDALPLLLFRSAGLFRAFPLAIRSLSTGRNSSHPAREALRTTHPPDALPHDDPALPLARPDRPPPALDDAGGLVGRRDADLARPPLPLGLGLGRRSAPVEEVARGYLGPGVAEVVRRLGLRQHRPVGRLPPSRLDHRTVHPSCIASHVVCKSAEEVPQARHAARHRPRPEPRRRRTGVRRGGRERPGRPGPEDGAGSMARRAREQRELLRVWLATARSGQVWVVRVAEEVPARLQTVIGLHWGRYTSRGGPRAKGTHALVEVELLVEHPLGNVAKVLVALGVVALDLAHRHVEDRVAARFDLGSLLGRALLERRAVQVEEVLSTEINDKDDELGADAPCAGAGGSSTP